MQTSPTIPPAKRTRSKVKDDSDTRAPVTRKSRSRKKPAIPAAAPDAEIIALHPDPDELAGLIATTAYFIAAERNFAPGQELEDWLEAERRVRSDCG